MNSVQLFQRGVEKQWTLPHRYHKDCREYSTTALNARSIRKLVERLKQIGHILRFRFTGPKHGRLPNESSDRLKRLRFRLSLSFDAISNFNIITVFSNNGGTGRRTKIQLYICVRRPELFHSEPHLTTCTQELPSHNQQTKPFEDLSHKWFCKGIGKH